MSSELIKISRDWSAVAGALLLAGPIAGSFADRLRTPTGLEDASPLTASSTGAGLLVGVLVVVVAVGYGLIVGRVAHARLALICTGLVLTWPAWRFGKVADLVRDAGDMSVVSKMILEGAIFGSIAVAGCLLVIRLSRSVEADAIDGEPLKVTAPKPESKPTDWALCAAATAIAGALAAWLLAQSPLQGQVYAAAVAAGVAGGAVGRSVASRAPMLAILIGGLSLAAIGPLAAQFLLSGDALTRLYAGEWPGLGLLTPFDWIAGVLVGAPLGEMWAHSMVDRQTGASPSGRPVQSA